MDNAATPRDAADDIPCEVQAMVERTFGPGVTIGPPIPQPHREPIVIPLVVWRDPDAEG